jgi:hypothetical protein
LFITQAPGEGRLAKISRDNVKFTSKVDLNDLCYVTQGEGGSKKCGKSDTYFLKGYILFITKFIGSSPNFNDASPNIEILKLF